MQSWEFRRFQHIALLVAIIIIGISLTAAGKYWRNVTLRDKEKNCSSGRPVPTAIEQYYLYLGRRQYPTSTTCSRTAGPR
jgi:type II secretory pathway pseudopilin PulG